MILERTLKQIFNKLFRQTQVYRSTYIQIYMFVQRLPCIRCVLRISIRYQYPVILHGLKNKIHQTFCGNPWSTRAKNPEWVVASSIVRKNVRLGIVIWCFTFEFFLQLSPLLSCIICDVLCFLIWNTGPKFYGKVRLVTSGIFKCHSDVLSAHRAITISR